MYKKTICTALLGMVLSHSQAQTYSNLWIPPTLSGTNFNLSLNITNKQYLPGTKTVTYGYNRNDFWGPTLIMNKGDIIQINLTNNLVDTTTTHWHGFHIPAIMDGGPHEVIAAGATWSPSYTVSNNASLYWYHPHLHQKTQDQLTHGAGGLIIVQDAQESALALPRTYGVDDIPVVLTSRRFSANQFVLTNSAYGDYMLVNGVLSYGNTNVQVSLPKQIVRLRFLNADIERTYNLGFSDNRSFSIIATDGGLLNVPIVTNRFVLTVGERIQILVDLTGGTLGSSFDLKSYNSTASLGGSGQSGLQFGYPGGENQIGGQFGSLLNNKDFSILHCVVAASTTNPTPITTIPSVLTTNVFPTTNEVTLARSISINGGANNGGVFYFDNFVTYNPSVINRYVGLNAVEKWTLANGPGFSHSFHIHDIQFLMISRSSPAGGLTPWESQGWKDTLYSQANSTNVFLARFDTFASGYNPFMYHCHFSDHEDGGTMGQFEVTNGVTENLSISSFTRTGTNKNILMRYKATPGTTYMLQYSTDTSTWSTIGYVTSTGTSANYTETDATRLSQARGFYRVAIPVNSY